jgi:cell division septum initiation protein DivIVA
MSETSVNFRTALRGYDTVQVDHHMTELAHSAASVWQQSAEQARQINELKAENDQLKSEVEAHTQKNRSLEGALREASEPSYAGFGERIGTVLRLVETEALELRTRAQADASNSRALAEEDALATRQDADGYAMGARSAADDQAAQIVEDARQQADSILEEARQQADSVVEDARQHADRVLEEADRQSMARQDADRLAIARREEAERAYEEARAKSAAAAVDFETTLAARREASALEFAAQVTASEQQLVAVRLRSEQARSDAEQAQQDAAAKIAQQMAQATARAHGLVSDAKAKAERLHENAERDLAAATRRRDIINAQLSSLREELASLGGPKRATPMPIDPDFPAEAGAGDEEEAAHETATEARADASELNGRAAPE